ncbi:hypothetical protein JOQ06_022878 [Pogonophryne albipinna]|uniref:Ig-like domain-containing protein n=1 Tax=Pogonophryne albipinna TaxID=1090488 RepID=A0AAD6A700_9TELE|nr:hypothetical protein JOQ06_022878 [Pogonophryne albipinna]
MYQDLITQYKKKKIETSENDQGAASKPSITTLDETKDFSLLQCEVSGAFPKPLLQWTDSSGKVLPAAEPQVSERGGSFYITLNANVTKTDRYQCVVTQEEINHETRAETFVHITGEEPEKSSVGKKGNASSKSPAAKSETDKLDPA